MNNVENVNHDPLVVELTCAVLSRAEQGMCDEDLIRYLDYRKRGLQPESEESAVIEDLKRGIVTEGTSLSDRINEIREKELKKRSQQAKERVERQVAHDVDIFIRRLWQDEQRYKRSLIPDNAWGGGSNGRSRKTNVKAYRWYRREYDV